MTPKHGSLIYEGKAKRVFDSDHPNHYWVEFKNDATAFNAQKHASLEGKGELNCKISASLFKFLEKEGISTHFIDTHGDNWMLVEKIDIIPLEVVIRNIATGSLCKQTPIKEGTKLTSPLCDFYYKDDELGDPLLTDARINLLGLIQPKDKILIEELAMKVNQILIPFMHKLDLILVDFKLEMGFNNLGALVIADEISPDNCRLWDQRTLNLNDRILDKDRFRKDLGGVVEAYREILKRVQALPHKSN